MEDILIMNGKKPDEPYNARLGFWLPPDSPYGNFQLKQMKLCQRLDEANRRLFDSYHFWRVAVTQGIVPINAYERHVYANEQAIYMMRRAADELISMIWCLSEFEKRRTYPKQIRIDCIGDLLKLADDQLLNVFRPHRAILQALNEIANAFKHSFINSDITLIGRDEPCVHALALQYNKLESGAKFHNVAMRDIVTGFNAFYQDTMQWLKEFSERNRQQGAPPDAQKATRR
jgi:hypothetical protein